MVAASDGNPLYRIPTGGPIGEGLGAFGTRTLLIPSGDNNLYGVDLLTRESPLDFSLGCADRAGTVGRRPGRLHRQHRRQFEPDRPRHRRATLDEPDAGRSSRRGQRDQALSCAVYNLDLFVMDRKTGRMMVDPGETHIRAGLNLREYDLDIVNRFNDRMYFATSSGMIVCLRETGTCRTSSASDPKALPFGYVPPEGLKLRLRPLQPPRPVHSQRPNQGQRMPPLSTRRTSPPPIKRKMQPNAAQVTYPGLTHPLIDNRSECGRMVGRRPGEGVFVGEVLESLRESQP